jgi:hypothetical protein
MAPQVEAAYAKLEGLVGAPLLQRLYAVLDELVESLEPAGDDGAGA